MPSAKKYVNAKRKPEDTSDQVDTGRSKKRKRDDAEPKPKPKRNKDKYNNKRKKSAVSDAPTDLAAKVTADAVVTEQPEVGADYVPLEPVGDVDADTELRSERKKKKAKMTRKEAQDITTPAIGSEAGASASIQEPQTSTDKTTAAVEESVDVPTGDVEVVAEEPSKKGRFIVFIGNLPFSATTESVTAHFAKIKPASVRHLTDKTTKKSKGYAFLEFEGYDRMLTCLKQFHHSSFEDGISPGRKINVELTAGGGGAKSVDRKDKLKAKNEKLNEQRRRRAEEEEKQKKRKELKDAKKQASAGGGQPSEAAPVAAEPDDGIHPSRRARIDGA